ncbi:MAG: hypothetical protein ACOX4J_09265 [Anaerovoracaceae bacterium]
MISTRLNWTLFLLSHAHIDHSGRIPLLVKRGFCGKIYCTDATADLLEVMLRDSAYIQQKEAEWQNRKNERAGRPLVEPLYTIRDAEVALRHIEPVLYNQLLAPGEDVKVVFNDAGHISGILHHRALRKGEWRAFEAGIHRRPWA